MIQFNVHQFNHDLNIVGRNYMLAGLLLCNYVFILELNGFN